MTANEDNWVSSDYDVSDGILTETYLSVFSVDVSGFADIRH